MSSPDVTALAFHPSVFILDELQARGWTLDDLAQHMEGDFGINRLALDFCIDVGPLEPGLRMGAVAAQLDRVFGMGDGFFERLEEAWLATSPQQIEAGVDDAAS